MIPEDLMRKYKYGYVHSCEMLNEPFVKNLIKENQELKKQLEAKNIQQKEFIDLLEGMYFEIDDNWWFAILNKYKEIIGVENANK